MRGGGLLSLLVLVAGSAAYGEEPRIDAGTALREGNRLFREGRIEAAVEAYRRGASPGDTEPLLAYNLGTSLHRLGRLPEAVLWYRRARAAGSTDPWLAENLERARGDLGAVELGPPRGLAPLLLHRWLGGTLAAALAWAALLAALLAPRRWRRPATSLLLATALAAWGGTLALRRLGPRPAVLLAGCSPSLPAGSEVWVARDSAGTFRVSGTGESCPAEAVALVEPTPEPEGP